jgi:hypothetical protein
MLPRCDVQTKDTSLAPRSHDRATVTWQASSRPHTHTAHTQGRIYGGHICSRARAHTHSHTGETHNHTCCIAFKTCNHTCCIAYKTCRLTARKRAIPTHTQHATQGSLTSANAYLSTLAPVHSTSITVYVMALRMEPTASHVFRK